MTNDVRFPDYPTDLLGREEVRQAYAIANANATFALEEAGINHDRSLDAAMATAATHDLDLDRTPAGYTEEAIDTLTVAIMETNDERFQTSLEETLDDLWQLKRELN